MSGATSLGSGPADGPAPVAGAVERTGLTLSQQLAAFAVNVRDRRDDPAVLPLAVVESVRQRVLDTLGICVAAASLPTSRAVRRVAASQGGRAESTAVGVPDRLPASQAAFVNGVLAHSLDYDDTHLPSVLHPSASVVPAALAVSEAAGADGLELLAAIAVGIEVTVRIGMAGYDQQAKQSIFFEHGQHATSICGTLGSAVAAAMLYGLDADGIASALGIAASMGSGLIEANRTGGTVKRMHCGWAAHSGVTAAQLVAAGLTGPPTVLEGRFGFFEAWLHGSFVPEAITDGLGSGWEVPGIFFKPYPANHFTHAGIDAGLALRAAGVDPHEITAIELRVPRQNFPTIGEPIEVKRAPQTGYMAQFSGPYTVVAALLGGGGLGVGLDDFSDELARAPDRRRLMALVSVVPDDECSAIFPAQFPAIVTVTLRDGRVLTERVLANRGGPLRPLSFDELTAKFRDNAERELGAERSLALAEAIHAIDCSASRSVAELLAPLMTIDPDNNQEEAR